MWQIYSSKQLAKLGRVNPLELLAELVLGYSLAHKFEAACLSLSSQKAGRGWQGPQPKLCASSNGSWWCQPPRRRLAEAGKVPSQSCVHQVMVLGGANLLPLISGFIGLFVVLQDGVANASED